MILQRLSISNFRQFLDTSIIDFAPPGDRNVTVLLGENGSGKTTFLNAFLWCFYGDVELENPEELLSYAAVSRASVGDEIPLEVSLTFQHADSRFVATRSGSFRKQDGGHVTPEIQPELRIDETKPGGAQERVADPKRLVGQILPRALSKFFLFRGEEMEALALQSSADRLRQGVERFFDFTVIDSAISHLWQVKKDYEDEMDDVAEGRVKEITEQIESTNQDIDECANKLVVLNKNVSALEEERAAVDKRLEEVEETRPYLEKAATLTKELEGLDALLDERKLELLRVISKDAFLFPSNDILDVVSDLAEGAVQRGELPASIKPGFVDERIDLGSCICGNPIDDSMRESLLSWKGVTGLAELEGAISQSQNAAREYRVRGEEAWTSYEEYRSKLAETESQIAEKTGERSAVLSELEGKDFDNEYIQGLQEKRRRLENDLIEEKTKRNRELDRKADLEKRVGELNDERKKHAKEQGKAELLQRRIDGADAVRVALSKMRSGRSQLIRTYLDQELRGTWNEIAQLERQVSVNEDFGLSIKERGGDGSWVTSAPSSANLKALSLCFVAALIKLAHSLGQDEADETGHVFQGGEYPLVMDAPFAKMDTYFKRSVPAGLRRSVPQIILISSNDQWKGEVAEGLGQTLGKKYVIELNRPGSPDESSTIVIDGQEVDYVISGVKDDNDWSLVREVADA